MADAECAKCIMLEEFKRIWEYNKEEKESRKETEKVVYEVKEGHAQTQFVMLQIQKNQEAQSLAMDKREAASLIVAEKNQEIAARNHKENKETNAAQFKAIEDRRIADAKTIEDKKIADDIAATLEAKEIAKEKIRLDELQDAKDEAARLEKKADRKAKAVQTWSLYLIGAGIFANFVMGILVKWAPTWIGLPVGK